MTNQLNEIDFIRGGCEFRIIHHEPMPNILHNLERVYRIKRCNLQCKVFGFWVEVCNRNDIYYNIHKGINTILTSVVFNDYTISFYMIKLVENKMNMTNSKGSFISKMYKILEYGI